MELSFATIPLLRNNLSLQHWLDLIETHIEEVETDVVVLPEYAWGRKPLGLDELHILEEREWKGTIIAGTAVIDDNGTRSNQAVVITNENRVVTIPKNSPMYHERERGIRGIYDPKVIIVDQGIKLGVMICADLWHHSLVNDYVDRGIDALMVPTMSVTLPQHGNYAKTLWHSLTVTRSREFVLPIVVSDHPGGEKTTTGFASAIADPSKKDPSLQSLKDFLNLPDENGIAMANVDFERIREYRNYRIKEGLISQSLEEIIK